MKKRTVTTLLIIAILVLVNLISEQYYFRIDLTEDREYTLDKTTKEILENLGEPITIKAYFSDNLPPHINKVKKYFKEYLIEYARISNNNLVYEFINPNESEKLKRQAISNGIYPVMISVRGENQIKQQQAFLGATLETGNEKEVIPFIQPGTALEYALSSAIKKITIVDKASIGLLTGYGSATLGDIKEVQSSLNMLYDFEAFDLKKDQHIPEIYQTIAVVRPKDRIPENVFNELDAFLERGGNLFLALNRVEGNVETAQGKEVDTGFESWLEKKGVIIHNNFVVDASCGAVGVMQGGELFSFMTNIEFPYIPVIKNFGDHPSTKGLELVVLKFASSINYLNQDSSSVFTPVAITSEKSGHMSAPLFFDLQKQWTKSDFPDKNLIVAGILEQTHSNGNQSNIFVVADGDFPVSNPQTGQKIHKDNANLMINAIDWLTDESGLINLRGKGIKYRPLVNLEEGMKIFLKYLNFFLPIVLVSFYGIIRAQRNKNKRIKRMLENY